ncbi:MAG: PAS domain S-box protein, partial [Euryarchaeota archaeon]|nr:PAS domain S-box protein [Euryarchaeota archaeon]
MTMLRDRSFSAGPTPRPRLVPVSGQAARERSAESLAPVFEAAFREASEAIAVLDPMGAYLEQNEAHRRLLGFADDELRGRTPAAHLGPESFDRILAALEATGRFRGEVVGRAKDGRQLKLEISVSTVRDPEGHVLARIGFLRPVSVPATPPAELGRGDAELREFVDHAPQGIHRIGPDGTVLWANERELGMFGYTADEYVGRNLAEFHVEAAVAGDLMARLRKGARIRGAEARVRCKDGTVKDVVIDADAHFENGGFVHARSFTRDVTERKRAERELRRLNEELERRVRERTLDLENLVRDRESFSYSVSHDLRTPLRTIRGFTTILLEDYAGKLDEKGRQYLEFVHGATGRMSEIIDDLLVLSRITRSEMRRRTVDVSALARRVVERLQEDEPGRDVKVDIAPDLVVEADAHLLEVLLENLLENAWKFTARTPGARIELAQEPSGARRFFVRDNGAGFDMAYVDRLFKPFQRLHSTR